MALTSLELLKKQVNADDFFTDDDLLATYLEAAEEKIVGDTRRDLAELVEIGGYGALPKPLEMAVLLLAAHWYNQREAVSGVQMAEVPYTISSLVKPYRRLS